MTDSSFLSHIRKPGRYLGSEYNAALSDDQPKKVKTALLFPDLYEIGMSHQGLLILYHILNATEHYAAERCYCPDKDAEALLRKSKKPLCALESGAPLASFDFLGITLPYELCYTNILTMLNLAGVPFYNWQRNEQHPLIVGGGACSMNPEPVADFFDVILLGDGEEAIIEICDSIATAKEQKKSRQEIIDALGSIDGIYLPAAYEPRYDSDGQFCEMIPRNGTSDPVRRVLANLEAADHLLHPIVPNAKIVHDRLGIEVARGCTRGCRFCQAGITYRPVRERRPEQILELAQAGIANSGFDELALLSLSTGDYSCLEEILPKLMDRFADNYVSVAMPSMRVGTLTPEIMNQIKRVRKTGFTLAPEAGSERLRRVINKGITEENLLATCRAAFSLGWKVLKCYFMVGLPTESEEDIDEIVRLINTIKKECCSLTTGKKQITVSVGTFVPKPHTPFQWDAQIDIETSRDRIFHLKRTLPKKGCSLKYHDPKISFLEGVFSRGDRRLAALLVTAWQAGARLDGWSDYFDLSIWEKAAQHLNINLNSYLQARKVGAILPWSHLSTGVDEQFFVAERQRAFAEVYTPDCRYHGCQRCGLCDFTTIAPIVHNKQSPESRQKAAVPTDSVTDRNTNLKEESEKHIKYMVHYTREGNICFLGHLEILQLIFRGLRRAGITTNFSKGFNPSPKISFGPALPVGTRSLAEFFIMDLPEPLASPEDAARQLSSKFPPGMQVTSIAPHSGKLPQAIETSYILELATPLTQQQHVAIKDFLQSEEVFITRERKGKKRQLNIRPLVSSLRILDEKTLQLNAISKEGAPGSKPAETIRHILGFDEQSVLQTIITKTSWRLWEND